LGKSADRATHGLTRAATENQKAGWWLFWIFFSKLPFVVNGNFVGAVPDRAMSFAGSRAL
jgi:hypothetical protein